MLEVFKDEIPKLEELGTTIRDWLSGPSEDLEELRELIYDHIVEDKIGNEVKEGENEVANKAMTVAFDVIEYLVYELKVSEINFRRLENYLGDHDSYNAYNRLIQDFADFMSNDEKQHLIKKGKKIFAKDITKHWRD